MNSTPRNAPRKRREFQIHVDGDLVGSVQPDAGTLPGVLSLAVPTGSLHYLPMPGGGVAVACFFLLEAAAAAARRADSEPIEDCWREVDLQAGERFLRLAYGVVGDGFGRTAVLRQWERHVHTLAGPRLVAPPHLVATAAAGLPVKLSGVPLGLIGPVVEL